jgi:acetolactate synthase-1/3 small subunit
MKQSKILVATVHDKPGVLTKITSIFYRRGLNILTLTVGHTAQPHVSKIVFRVVGEDEELKRLMLSVENIVDVLSVDIQPDNAETARELCVACIGMSTVVEHKQCDELLSKFPVRVLLKNEDSLTVEMVGSPDAIDMFIAQLQHLTLIDLSRTGATLMPRS